MQDIKLSNKTAQGDVVPLFGVTMVYAKTDKGFVGCGLYDVNVFDKFGCPAAKVRSPKGPITDMQGLLDSPVVEVNSCAKAVGVHEGITGRDALEKL